MSQTDPRQVTRLIQDAGNGKKDAVRKLFPLVYDELRVLARAQIRRGRENATLEPTALVHEAFLRIAGQSQLDLRDRSHFFALAAAVMRSVLVDHYRRRRARKRGGGWLRVTLDRAPAPDDEGVDVLALDEALRKLGELDERKSRVVELRFFGGLSVEETSVVLGVSKRTVEADWTLARAWLNRELEGS